MKFGTMLQLAALCCAGEMIAAEAVPATPAEQSADAGELRGLNRSLLEKLSPSLVEVDYFLKEDETGQRPELRVGYLCSGCGSMHYGDATRQIAEQRPMTTPGYVLAPNEFLASDTGLLPDWYGRLEIRFGGKSYPGSITGYYPERRSVRIRTDVPIPGVRPLRFLPDWKGKLFAFFLADENGIRLAGATPYSPTRVEREVSTGREQLKMLPNTLLVNPEGEVIALSMTESFPLGDKPFAPPGEWKFVPEKERTEKLAAFGKMLEENFYPVTVRFSVETKKQRRFQSGEEQRREADAVAMRLPDGKVLINLPLPPTETARLSRITLQVGEKTVDAKFTGSLPLFGGFVALPDSPLPGKGIEFSSNDIVAFRNQPVLVAPLRVFGRKLDVRVIPGILDQFSRGFRGTVNPEIPQDSDYSYVFSPDGKLLALPLARRKLEKNYGNNADFNTVNVQVLADELKKFDTDNIPRAKGAETAWLGADFQKLDESLARANRVSELTENGERGLLVTRIHPDSPAAKLGLKVGDILLGLQLPGQPLVVFKGYEYDRSEGRQFPWEHYDQIPAEYYDEIPTPWVGIDHALNRQLSEAGIGRKLKLAIIADGKVEFRELTVTAAPENFDSTEKFNDAGLGMSVANLTFEVRDYFKLKPGDAGVVISRVRAGGSAAVAGLKPYEIIQSVNDTPVKNIEEFKRLVENSKELKFAVRRFNATRIVTLSPDAKNNVEKK